MKRNKNNSLFFILGLFIYNISIFTDFLSYNTVLKVIALLLLFVEFMMNRKNLKFDRSMIFLMLFSLIILLNLFFNGDLIYIITFIINIIIMFMLIQFPDYPKYELKFILFFSIMHIFFSIFVLIAPPSIVNVIFKRIIGEGFNINYSWRIVSGINVGITKQPGVLSIYMTVSFIYFFTRLLKKKNVLLDIVGLLLSIIVVFLTTKRSALIISFLTIILMSLCFFNKKISIKKTFKFLFLIVISCSILFFINTKYNFINDVLQKNDISNGRTEIWRDSLELFWNKPIFGIGLKSYYKLKGYDIHNNYIQFLVEMGIFGFSVFIICFGYVIFKCLSFCKKKYKTGLQNIPNHTLIGIFLIIFFLFYSFVGNTLIDYLPLSLFSIAISFIYNDYFYGGRQQL